MKMPKICCDSERNDTAYEARKVLLPNLSQENRLALVRKESRDHDVCRIVVADEHQLLRSFIVGLLDQIHGVEVIGEASNMSETLDLVATLSPHILLLGLVESHESDSILFELVTNDFPQTKLIVSWLHAGAEYEQHAFRMGASGYICKYRLADELELAITEIGKGNRWLSIFRDR